MAVVLMGIGVQNESQRWFTKADEYSGYLCQDHYLCG